MKKKILKMDNVKEYILVNEPILTGKEKIYLNECIDSSWISSEGRFVKLFEEGFASKVDRKFGVAVNNGSAALEAAVKALNIGPGDEVILPTFTIISCAAAVVRNGATPVLVDCDPCTWNMVANDIQKKITPKTKAIMVVHIYGLPVDIDPIISLAKRYELKIIEDSAEMHGQYYKDRPCGSFGDVSVFSFYSNKIITTGEGGMILTDNKEIAERCRSLRNLCFNKKNRFVHKDLGWNMRMSNLQAAVGLAQLDNLERFVKMKRKIGRFYNKILSDIPNLQFPVPRTSYSENLYWVYGLVIQNKKNMAAKSIMALLKKNKIESRPFFWPMHKQPVFKKMGFFKGESYPNAEEISKFGFYIPSGLAINKAKMEYVSAVLHKILKTN